MITIGNPIDLPAQRISYDPARGDSWSQIWEGTLESCFARAMELRRLRPDLSFVLETVDGPLWRITQQSPDLVNAPSETEAITTWELAGNEISHDIFESQLALEVPDSQIALIKEAHAKNQAISEIQGQLGDAGLALISLLYRGVTNFLDGQYVLRKSQIVSAASSIRVAFANTGGVFSMNAAIAQFGLPATLLFSIGEIPIPTIVDTGTSVVPPSELYAVGWLKKTPTVTQTARSKFEIRQEYWFGIWATDLYPLVA